ncbi:hypothetical protein [Thiovibrio frasassiensis]|uniref:Uncharacterized protein n=1 Tax=Thiovibrio frasassiensis TaxID=2984131 RepID=A0A9X4RMY3_9BACT|nr:hypothetical protein [Thiovibrio frasassiensis]MDG4476678.1 hypothetical protein [Thiovibrio frasassiensis]
MKEIDHSCLLAIHPLSQQGSQALQNLWPAFIQTLRKLLVQVGVESAESTPDLLLIYYDEPFTALSTLIESLESLKKQHWHADKGAVSIQVILHLHRKKDPPIDFAETSAPVWGLLQPETPYITRALKLQWEQIFAGKKMPAHQFVDAGDGLFQLVFSGDLSTLRRERLFTGKVLAAKGTCSECFYCGLSNHVPAHCPSKHLTMETRSLNRVGYLPLPKIDSLFKQVMAEQKKMAELLTTNIDTAQIRSDLLLQVYVAYFDLYLIYQPRFLANSTFSLLSSWDGGGKTDKMRIDRVKIDSRNLQAGFDCLRLGQYKQAIDFMKVENQALGGKQFYATIGLAFVALERGGLGDMAQFLQIAHSTASSEKEKIYINLLYARFHRLAGHPWKAEQLMSSVANLYVDCSELQYSLIQIRVHEGQGQQQMQLLRKLVTGDRRYFMISLMDPALLPANSMVENVLSGLLEQKTKEAAEYLAEAQEALAVLQTWFGEEQDEELQTNLTALANLEEQFRRSAVYDVLDIAERAKPLSMLCPRLREARLEALNDQVDAAALVWADYNAFWKEYPYQSFFRDFKELLYAGKRKFVEARSIAGENLAKGRERLQTGQAKVELLTGQVERMLKLKIALDTLMIFFKKLIVAELVFSVLAFLTLPLITIVLSGIIDPDIVRLAKNPQTQKGCMVLLTLFLAPFSALALTIRSMSER